MNHSTKQTQNNTCDLIKKEKQQRHVQQYLVELTLLLQILTRQERNKCRRNYTILVERFMGLFLLV